MVHKTKQVFVMNNLFFTQWMKKQNFIFAVEIQQGNGVQQSPTMTLIHTHMKSIKLPQIKRCEMTLSDGVHFSCGDLAHSHRRMHFRTFTNNRRQLKLTPQKIYEKQLNN